MKRHKNNARAAIIAAVSVAILFVSCASAKPVVETAIAPVAEDDFWTLIEKGENEKARALFKGKADIKSKDAKGRTPLHVAAERKDAELAAYLIAIGASVDEQDGEKRTPLEIACINGDAQVARKLSEGGADIFKKGSSGKAPAEYALEAGGPLLDAVASKSNIEAKNGKGETMLHLAADSGDGEAVSLLLAKGAKPLQKSAEGKTPLDLAYRHPESLEYALVAEKLIIAGSQSSDANFSYFSASVRSANFSLRFDDGLTPLHFAAREGQLGFIAYLFQKKADPDAKSASGATPLHEAIRAGKIDAAKALIAAGADVNARDAKGNSAMHLFMPLNSRQAGVELLLSAKADPNIKDDYGDAPLHVAIALNMGVPFIAVLLKGGADPNIRNTAGRTPLHSAVERDRPEYVPTLLDKGANIFAADDAGSTPFDLALKSGGNVLQAMITAATVAMSDNVGNTPLHVAVAAGAPSKIVALILDRKAAVNARNKSGDTPLHLAVADDSRELGELLIARGADIFATNAAGKSPLYLAGHTPAGFLEWMLNSTTIEARDGLGNGMLHFAAGWKLEAAIPSIIQKGADPNAQNATGETPIFSAVKADSPATIAVLIKNGADSASRDALGNTSLHAAVRWNAKSSALALLAQGADPNARNLAGKMPLHDAVRLGIVDLEKVLVNGGAKLEGRDLKGATPLMEAVSAGSLSATERLLERGANPTARNMQGDTPLHVSVAAGRTDIAKLLLSIGTSIHAENSFGMSPLKSALSAGPEMTTLLLTKDRIDAANDLGKTPLHIALEEGADLQAIRTIVNLGARVSDPDFHGRTPLRIAVGMGKLEESRLLVDAGSDVFAQADDGESPATLAIVAGTQAVKALFDGTAISAKDAIGYTPLHYAAFRGKSDVVKILIELGAVKSARNVAGESPADLAHRWGLVENEKLLR
ncbi:MAG: hypothetical protein A2Z99_04955 [Treponema sp. GWB1_62_6]|nr:MAG: hypothetical protein A2001_15755 [Treponema sp. GWC1_61_84]OHE67264.1 MAG: hypothetical protein A2Z99_04955 [Treponema sp. GWB1_62_6]